VPGLSRRRNSSLCTFCCRPAPSAHCLVLTKNWDGTWRKMYRLCRECALAELEWARSQSYPETTRFQYYWALAEV